jgi:membrane associated rhomboid family serine protease
VPPARKRRAARARAARGAAAPVPATPPQARAGRPVAPAPPWSRRALLVLVGLVAALQTLFALIDSLRDRHHYGYGVYLVGSLGPGSLPQQAEVLVSFLIVMPLARRLGGERRPMGVLETLSVGALTMLLLAILWQLAGIAAGGHPSPGAGRVPATAVVAGAVADVAGLVLGAVLYPRIHRLFWRQAAPR